MDIEVPAILKWGGWVKKNASMRGTAGGEGYVPMRGYVEGIITWNVFLVGFLTKLCP